MFVTGLYGTVEEFERLPGFAQLMGHKDPIIGEPPTV